MADVKAELNGQSVSFNTEVVASMSEKEFVDTYMADDAMYAHSSPEDKKRALTTVYRTVVPNVPKKTKTTETTPASE